MVLEIKAPLIIAHATILLEATNTNTYRTADADVPK